MKIFFILSLLIHCFAFAGDIPASLNLDESIHLLLHIIRMFCLQERIAAVGGQKITAYSYFFPFQIVLRYEAPLFHLF